MNDYEQLAEDLERVIRDLTGTIAVVDAEDEDDVDRAVEILEGIRARAKEKA